MAITLRRIDNIRAALDDYKKQVGTKTDSKAIEEMVLAYQRIAKAEVVMMAEHEHVRQRLAQFQQTISSLEDSIVPALELLRQQKMDI